VAGLRQGVKRPIHNPPGLGQSRERPLWIKTRNPQSEQMLSAFPSKADVRRRNEVSIPGFVLTVRLRDFGVLFAGTQAR
jgi:hypothetical protein